MPSTFNQDYSVGLQSVQHPFRLMSETIGLKRSQNKLSELNTIVCGTSTTYFSAILTKALNLESSLRRYAECDSKTVPIALKNRWKQIKKENNLRQIVSCVKDTFLKLISTDFTSYKKISYNWYLLHMPRRRTSRTPHWFPPWASSTLARIFYQSTGNLSEARIPNFIQK